MPGFLDNVSPKRIRGWAIHGGAPAHLVASVNGLVVARFQAHLPRPDLAQEPRQDLGFDLELPATLRIGDVLSVTEEDGAHLTGSPHYRNHITATRQEKALWLISREAKILEIGPAYNPLTPKADGWNSFSVDHADEDELRRKYAGQQAVSQIERVDYLWKAGPLESAIPTSEHGTFDAVIASHVIEHFPDPLGFLRSTATLLKESGILSLVIPDKRRCFDFFKPLTTTGDYVHCYKSRRTRHTSKTAFDNLAYNVQERGEIAWSPRLVRQFEIVGNETLDAAYSFSESLIEDESGPYVDFHATTYVPSSFSLIMLELAQLGLLPFLIEQNFPTEGCEFFVSLRKGKPARHSPKTLADERLRLMKELIREQAEQARWLIDEQTN